MIEELQQERDRIDAALEVLRSLDGNSSKRSSGRIMSVAARRRIAAAQRARWAKKKTPKRRISAAGLARIRAAAKARWARVKGEKKK
jgi:hypothetical protein